MGLSSVLSNGNMLVGLDPLGRVRNIYYPYVGEEDHVGGNDPSLVHRIGVWVDGKFSWVEDGWEVRRSVEALVGADDIVLSHPKYPVKILITSCVDYEKNIFLRSVTLENESDEHIEVRVFFAHEFHISETTRGNSVYYDPDIAAVIHHRGSRVFAIGGRNGEGAFDQFTTGVFDEKKESGSYIDALDGELSGNLVELGATDSVVRFSATVSPQEHSRFYYWLIAGRSYKDIQKTLKYVYQSTPALLLQETRSYWSAWANKSEKILGGLPRGIDTEFKKSLEVVRAHMDNGGAIIASADSSMLFTGVDTYAYCWFRDASYAVDALDGAGYHESARQFFRYAAKVIDDAGYMHHKYIPSGAVGSTWHPKKTLRNESLPIQADETASVLWALWRHYERDRDLEFLQDLWFPLIRKAAQFLVSYRNPETGLPRASYGLWEQERGVYTYTTAATAAGLLAAANLADALGKDTHATTYRGAASEIREAITDELFDADSELFLQGIAFTETDDIPDKAIDSSVLYALYNFEILDPKDRRLKRYADAVKERLASGMKPGTARFEGDSYFRADGRTPGNPWSITSFWLIGYEMVAAESVDELNAQLDILKLWSEAHIGSDGMIAEQFDPRNSGHISASPLTWGHAEYIRLVLLYVQRKKELT